MAITHVQDAHLATFFPVRLASPVTAGNTLFATMGFDTNGGSVGSVLSITDNLGGRWIQAAFANSPNSRCELWYCRGTHAGSVAVTAAFEGATTGFNLSEFSGTWSRDPLDTWSQNFGSSASITAQTVNPRGNGDLIIAVAAQATTAGSIGPVVGGLTNLTMGNSAMAGYTVLSGSVAPQIHWPNVGITETDWSALECAFVPGQSFVNPDLQFPEALIEISTTNNYLAPIQGLGVWTNISQYVKGMTLGPLGRSHYLDRVQSTLADITVDNRSGVFNRWNTTSFLYNGGLGLAPMNPVKVTAAWDGVTNPEYYGYVQAITPQIIDVLNVDAVIDCVDILQQMSLKYLSSNVYEDLVIADGGANLAAYYRLGDTVGSYSVKDSSGNGRNGSLIDGVGGTPLYGAPGVFLYDADTALDLTNGSNLPNGGFSTYDNTTQPPTMNEPLGGASVWTFETWLKWTGTGDRPPLSTIFCAQNGTSVTNTPCMIQFGTGIFEGTGAAFNFSTLATYPNSLVFSPGWHGVEWQPNTVYGTSVFLCPSGAPGFAFLGSGGTSGNTQPNWNTNIATGSTPDGTIAGWLCVSNFLVLVENVPMIADGAWHNLTIEYGGGSNAFVVFIDGVNYPVSKRDGFVPPYPVFGNDPTGIIVGTEPNAIDPFPGTLDEVAFYTSALSLNQAVNHYNTALWFQLEEFGASVGTPAAGRFNKVMDLIGLDPSIMLDVPYPFRTLMYAETNAITTTSALNYMQTQSETEPGMIFQDNTGMIQAYSRQYQYINPTSVTSQAIFADNTGASVTGHYDGPTLQIAQDDVDIWNDIQVQSGRANSQLQEWGPNQSAAAALSASISGQRTMQGLTSLQQQYDTDALAIAQNYSNWYNFPIPRVTQMVLNSQGGEGANIPQMLQRGLMDRITVQYQGQTPGPPFLQDSLIESINHAVDMAGPTWTTTYALSPYEILMNPFIFGSSAQMSGAASVTGSGTAWVVHGPSNPYRSGTVIFTVASGAQTDVAYNATAAIVQSALAALVPSTTVTGGPISTSNVNITFGAGQSSFAAYFKSGDQLTL